ncbi:anti-sigma factor family protein [Streptomyces cinnamoneus]|uniref:anti-sigma factor family protein n=1 Tax=Streptomyces cinnamoneus TaxID=53446 RepID=UPI003789FDC7
MTGSGGQSPAEQHLGDRLAALVDGELGHDARERVLAHLATCGKCKAEADAQRRIKNVFAQAAVPPVSDALLARLQGLPGEMTREPADGGPGPGDARGRGFGARAEAFAFLPAVTVQPGDGGFRIHDFERGPGVRAGSRGRRFAFAAAGTVSLAALALVGAQPLGTAVETPRARGGGQSSVTTTSLAMSQGLGGQSDSVRTPAATAFSPVALLRPSGAPVHPPLIRTSLARTATPPERSRAQSGRAAAAR